MLRCLAAILTLLTLAHPAFADRVALVLGNGAYQATSPLANAPNDAADMADRLRSLGFRVFEGIDLGRDQTLQLVDAFARDLTPEDTALFYFAGHGVQIGRQNYLIPVDAQAGDEEALVAASVRLDAVLRAMELRAGARVVILDACRNNPFLEGSSSRSGGRGERGLSKVEAGVGSYIAFSTQPGNVALDGQGRNSPFTAALLDYIGTPDADIHAVMRKVRASVVDASGGTQIPWENSSLLDELFLTSAPTPAPQAPPPQHPQSKVVLPDDMPMRPAVPNTPRPRIAGESCLSLKGGARLCASSVLEPQSGNRYGPENLLDDTGATAWVEGQSNHGEGAYLAIDLPEATDIAAVELINGYPKSDATFIRNGRVRLLNVYASNDEVRTLRLEDHAGWQSFPLDGFTGVTWILLEIGDVYRGQKWPDTAIAELRIR
ncbi:caspase family protein [Tropicimonas sp. IMCC6043]|uniref:caspase family protein n=1 Tax=Tropicimonas sp. IMCC6043 TaxID=2510645 RepID=UPI00101BA143|nr:caspase family protein [Tropicimonas sp. IMCC6043]RYH08424.1 hypothetical protein EU800_16480 [Tropicimonas sp. IMCC6043]